MRSKVWFQSEGSRPKKLMLQLESESREKPMFKMSRRKNSLLIPGDQHFCFIQAFNQLDQAHPHQGSQSAFLSLPIPILIILLNLLTDILKIMFDQIYGHPVIQSTRHIKLTFMISFSYFFFTPRLSCSFLLIEFQKGSSELGCLGQRVWKNALGGGQGTRHLTSCPLLFIVLMFLRTVFEGTSILFLSPGTAL